MNIIFKNYFWELANAYIKGRLIDIGCGIKHYKEKLSHLVTEHISVDHEITVHNPSNIDLFGTACNISTADNSIDSAICTAVLEHLEEPVQAIRGMLSDVKKRWLYCLLRSIFWQLHEQPRYFLGIQNLA